MLTNKDNEIRTADIPERFQVCCKKLISSFKNVNLCGFTASLNPMLQPL